MSIKSSPEYKLRLSAGISKGWESRSRQRTPEAIANLQASHDARSAEVKALRRLIITNAPLELNLGNYTLSKQGSLVQEWGKMVIERDNSTCQTCGVVGVGRQIIAHHIIDFTHRSEASDITLSNGITLCKACHCRLHRPDNIRWGH